MVSANQSKGMVLEPIPSFNSSLLSIFNYLSKLGSSRMLNSENFHVKNVNKTLDSIITSIPEILLNRSPSSSIETLCLPCALSKNPHYNLRT